MLIKTVRYSALINLGNYNNERIGFTVKVEENENIKEVVEALKQKVIEVGGLEAEKMYQAIYRNQKELKELEYKVVQARNNWEATAEFLRTQGIKPDTVDMPMFTNLLPEIKEEDSSIIEGEIDSEEDEEEEGELEEEEDELEEEGGF